MSKEHTLHLPSCISANSNLSTGIDNNYLMILKALILILYHSEFLHYCVWLGFSDCFKTQDGNNQKHLPSAFRYFKSLQLVFWCCWTIAGYIATGEIFFSWSCAGMSWKKREYMVTLPCLQQLATGLCQQNICSAGKICTYDWAPNL